jgi:hypothetical protein
MQEGDVRELDLPEGLTGPALEEGTTAPPHKPSAVPEIPKPDGLVQSRGRKPKLETQVTSCWCQSSHERQLAFPVSSAYPGPNL